MSLQHFLDFARDGRLICGGRDGLRIVDVTGAIAPLAIVIDELAAVLALDGEVWTVAGTPPTLRRFGAARGEPIGTPLALAGSGQLTGAASAGKLALWSGVPAMSLSAEGDAVTALAVPGELDHAIAVSRTRWLTVRRGQARLRDLATERWAATIAPADWSVRSGAAIFDGRSAALELVAPVVGDAAPVTQLVVISLRDGVVQHRMTIAGITMLRIAAQRGHALVVVGRRLMLVDLRFGRVIAEHDCETAPLGVAIDPAAQQIALRLGDRDEDVVSLPVRELLAAWGARATAAEVEEVVTPAALPPVAALPHQAETVAAVQFHVGHAALRTMPALAPRPAITPISDAENRRLLAGYHRLLTAQVARAIAASWDQGRLAYPDDSGHPFQSEVTGLRGATRGKASAELAASELEVGDASAAVDATIAATAPRLPPLQALTAELGISPLGQTILLLVAGPALWGDLARLYGILGNDEARELVDEWLLAQILSPQVDAEAIARELDRDQPLLRGGLLRVSGSRMRPFAGLSCDPVVLKLLRGAPVDAELDDDVRVAPPPRPLDELLIPATIKDGALRDLAALTGDPATTRLAVRGRTGAGRHSLLATLAGAAGRRLGVIDAAPMARDAKTLGERLRTALRRAHIVGLLPCVDGLEALASDDQGSRDIVREVLRRHPGPLAVRLPRDAQPLLDPGHVSVELPTLSIAERLTCWGVSLARHRLSVREPLELATRYAVGPGVIERVCAAVDVRDLGPDDDHGARLDAAVRQHLESRLGTIATRVHRLSSWAHVVLPPDIEDSLLELIARISHRGLVFDAWGFDAVMSTTRGVTALFQGGPGTGKTMVAGAIANELGMDLYRVDLSRVMSKWIGETEQNLAKLFDAAEDGHAIILFDEADSLFAKRTEVRTSVDRYANLEVNYLLQRLDSFEGIAILTTNFGTGIDNAFRRRLSFRLTFPFPDEEMREQLWKAHLPPAAPTAGAFDLAALARRYRLSGGYIRNAVLRAAFLAAEERTPITHDHLERAIKAEFREIGKLSDSGVLE